MRWNRGRSVAELCTELAEAIDRQDEGAAQKAFKEIVGEVERADAAALTEALVALRPALAEVPLGNGAPLAALAGGLVEAGGDPAAALDVLASRVAEGLEQASRFPALAGTEVEPPTDGESARAIVERVAEAGGFDVDEASQVTQAWFTVNEWIPALLLPLQQKAGRAALPHRQRLIEAASVVPDEIADAHWLLGLLLVLDDEPLVVVHRASEAVFLLTISGVGDNFQLHTLLADALVGGGHLPGEPPEPSWVAAASDGPLQPQGPIHGQFNLVDAGGKWIWNEGRPVDVEPVAGRRIIVLDPAPYDRTWNVGRVYPLMLPEVRLDAVLPPDQAAGWLRLVSPAKDDRPGPM
ncbi:hypothetical protein Ais01nite_36770 [Asanoa ishikariensis]|uniref:hypothetical protein n=1 Tax=Asanoa ishikariensis TaxID=137265 RepID=UPI00115F94CB|nr:hypothetical protein [Asanoa ishikariensis]GIF65642.1 hypothetical protein Ais01nite_36770 [Asanoa ishikariensis]